MTETADWLEHGLSTLGSAAWSDASSKVQCKSDSNASSLRGADAMRNLTMTLENQ